MRMSLLAPSMLEPDATLKPALAAIDRFMKARRETRFMLIFVFSC
jgi:hypothetical protein